MNQPVLVVDRLTKDYGGYRAVDAISFSIERGQVLGLLGANGAGKSTTIQMLLGITTSTAGTISYFGQAFDPRHRQHCLQRINFTSAYNTLQGRISVLENLIVFAGLYNVRKPRRKIDSLLDYFDIGRLANQRYYDLSAGERAFLLSADRGQGLLSAGTQRVAFQSIASPTEHYLVTSDPKFLATLQDSETNSGWVDVP